MALSRVIAVLIGGACAVTYMAHNPQLEDWDLGCVADEFDKNPIFVDDVILIPTMGPQAEVDDYLTHLIIVDYMHWGYGVFYCEHNQTLERPIVTPDKGEVMAEHADLHRSAPLSLRRRMRRLRCWDPTLRYLEGHCAFAVIHKRITNQIPVLEDIMRLRVEVVEMYKLHPDLLTAVADVENMPSDEIFDKMQHTYWGGIPEFSILAWLYKQIAILNLENGHMTVVGNPNHPLIHLAYQRCHYEFLQSRCCHRGWDKRAARRVAGWGAGADAHTCRGAGCRGQRGRSPSTPEYILLISERFALPQSPTTPPLGWKHEFV